MKTHRVKKKLRVNEGTDKVTTISQDPGEANFLASIIGDFKQSPPPALKAVLNNPNDELLKLAKDCRIDPSAALMEPQTVLEIVQGGRSSALATLGNFSAVIGKAKARKGFLIVLLIWALMRKEFDAEAIISAPKQKTKIRVLWFDTEQSPYHLQKAVKRVCKLTGDNALENLHVYGQRKFPTEMRLKMIEYLIYNTPDITVVVIDGIRDLALDINDPKEATKLVNYLLKWTEELNIHIIVVLHQNKGDLNARGHLGTEIINKAESVISVTKNQDNQDISTVEAEYCRDRAFDPFCFTIDDAGIPNIMDGYSPIKKDGKKQRAGFDEINELIHRRVINETLPGDTKMKYGELCLEIKTRFESIGHRIGSNTICEFITRYTQKAWIVKDKPAGERYPVYRRA